MLHAPALSRVPETCDHTHVAVLIVGLVLFLSPHLVRVFADDWRTRQLARIGAGPYKGAYSLLAVVGLGVTVWGFGLARAEPVEVFWPPIWLRHVNVLFTLLAFILLAAAYVPRNHIRAAIGHPMYAGTKTWALGHLLATGLLHDIVLFGAILAWAVLGFIAARRRDRRDGTEYPAGTAVGTVGTVAAGAAAWAVFAFALHTWLIGVSPFA
jgi:uncharacterized membrane protein